MDSSEVEALSEALIRIFIVLLFVSVCVITYWRLFPRLSPNSKRMASLMLAAQILVIVVSLELRPTSNVQQWLWHLDREKNIPATLASTQLALVGVVALTTAWLARARPTLQRLYLAAIGAVFLFLAQDEFFRYTSRFAIGRFTILDSAPRWRRERRS